MSLSQCTCDHCGHKLPDCECNALQEELRQVNIPVRLESVNGEDSAGFGEPWFIIQIGDIELAAIEATSDEYDEAGIDQDGWSPVLITGWSWRPLNDERCMTTGWTDAFDSAKEALSDAMRQMK